MAQGVVQWLARVNTGVKQLRKYSFSKLSTNGCTLGIRLLVNVERWWKDEMTHNSIASRLAASPWAKHWSAARAVSTAAGSWRANLCHASCLPDKPKGYPLSQPVSKLCFVNTFKVCEIFKGEFIPVCTVWLLFIIILRHIHKKQSWVTMLSLYTYFF